jgi:hypothetical protein
LRFYKKDSASKPDKVYENFGKDDDSNESGSSNNDWESLGEYLFFQNFFDEE